MKILIATGVYAPDIGGPATYSKLLKDELPKHGIDVQVLSFGQVRHLPKIVRHFIYFLKVLKLGKRVDIIFTQDAVSVGVPSMLAARLLNKKFVVRLPGDYAWEQATQRYGVTDFIEEFQDRQYAIQVNFLKWVQRKIVKSADKVIVPSDYFKKIVISWGLSAKKVVRIYNGIEIKTKEKIPTDVPDCNIIFSAGRLMALKGFSCLITLLSKLPDWHLVIAGEGPELQKLQKLAKEKSVFNRITFLGRISREEVLGWYKMADVFVLNSAFESFSFQVVEAMHSRIPVITTNAGALPELIDNGVHGLTVAPDDNVAILKGIQSVKEDTTKWKDMTEAATKKAETFSVDKTVESVSRLFKSL